MKTIGSLTSIQRSNALLLACIGLMTLIGCASNQPPETSSQTDSRTNAVEAAANPNNLVPTENVEQAAVPAQPNNAAKEVVISQPTEAYIEPIQTNVQADVSVAVAPPGEIEEGMTYAEARTILIQQGWIPNEGPDPGPYGAERALYDVGFREVDACSGTGVGYCNFGFFRPNGDRFGVTTTGGTRPVVSHWGLSPADETTAAVNTNAASAQSSAIPIQFQGEWDYGIEGCYSSVSDGRLRIFADRIQYYASAGPVTEIVSQSEFEITVEVELMEEGQPFTSLKTYQLSSDRTELTDLTLGLTRQRCP